MDEGTTGLTTVGTNGGSDLKNSSVPETAAQLENDIEEIRNHLSDVAGELDRRRHRMFDLPGQVRRRAKPIAIGTAALALAGLGLWWWRRRSRRRVTGRLLSSLRGALPDGVAAGQWFDDLRERAAETIHPTPPAHPVRGSLFKISTAGAAAVASALGKHLAGKAVAARWPAAPDEESRRPTDYSR